MSHQLYAYLFEDATQQYGYNNAAHVIDLAGALYQPVSISHTAPTFSSDPSQARITVRMRDDLTVPMNYISHPPPSKTALTIYEVIETTVSGNRLVVTRFEPHWKGRIVRVAWKDSFRAVEITCKTQHDIHFARETNTETLSTLCRFHVGDGRCPVNIEDFKETVTVVDVSDDISEPTVEVNGLAQIDDYYVPGMIRLGDGDMRQIEANVAGVLTLSRAFPSTSIQDGDSVEVFAGDDLTFEVCSVVFGAATNNGEAWGGWKLTPNRDFQKDGIR